jgi:hypothetical protein
MFTQSHSDSVSADIESNGAIFATCINPVALCTALLLNAGEAAFRRFIVICKKPPHLRFISMRLRAQLQDFRALRNY